jgi:hypothetical protein
MLFAEWPQPALQFRQGEDIVICAHNRTLTEHGWEENTNKTAILTPEQELIASAYTDGWNVSEIVAASYRCTDQML